VLDDHRRTGAGPVTGADAYLGFAAAAFELTRDMSVYPLYFAATAPHGLVVVVRAAGTHGEGGAFESVYVIVMLRGDDRIARFEFYEPEELERALARLEALRPDPAASAPSAAMRLRERHRSAFLARDGRAARPRRPDFVYEDRGRRALVSDVETWLGSMQFTTQPGFRPRARCSPAGTVSASTWW
jgi:hypothetical protein